MTKYKWVFVESEEYLLTDDEYQLYADGKDTHIRLQCCAYAGGYSVNSSEYQNGRLIAVTDHGVIKSLNKAKKKAIHIYETQQKTA